MTETTTMKTMLEKTNATTHLLPLVLLAALVGCKSTEDEGATNPEQVTTTPPVDTPARVEPGPTSNMEPPVDVDRIGKEGTTDELIAALQNRKPDSDPLYVVIRPGVKVKDRVVVGGAEPVGRAMRLEGADKVIVELLLDGADFQATIPLQDVRYMKTLDLAFLGQETQRVTVAAVAEIDDFDLDEEARRSIDKPLGYGLVPNGGPAGVAPDFDCVARFARISASLPFPLTNCAAPQDPVGDPERIADATQAKKVAQNIFNQQLTAYTNAQAMIAALNARMVAIQNAYVFIRHDPHFKEYNITHFKDFLHGRKSYNDRYKRAEALLVAAAQITQAQIAMYSQVPPPNANVARSDANRIVAKKWNCVLHPGLLNNGGRSGSTIVGVSLETLGAPFVDIQVMLDDHPPLPQKDGWGGMFDLNVTPNLPSDVTRLPVSGFVPVTASVGLPIVMFRFQPLDAKKTRPVGKACNLRAGIVL